jgi:hypothetical protein
MPVTIIHKKGSGIPSAESLEVAEVAVDIVTGILYSKLQNGEVVAVGSSDGGGSNVSVSDDMPVDPESGDMWYCTKADSEGMFVFDNGIWFESTTPGPEGGGISYTTETSDYTLEANQGVIADTTGGTFVVTLPLTPEEGDQVVVADGGDWSTTNLTVGRNGQTIEGVASDLTMDVGGISVTMVFDGTTWQLYPATGTSGTSGSVVDLTLDQVTTAGNTTNNDITVGNLTSSTGTNTDVGPVSISLGGTVSNTRRALWTKDTTSPRDMAFYAATGGSSSDTVFYRNATDESMRLDANGNVTLNGKMFVDDPAYGLTIIDGYRLDFGREGSCYISSKKGGDILIQGDDENIARFHQNKDFTCYGVIRKNGNTPVMAFDDMIKTLSTLRKATMDETQDIRESLRDAIDELVSGFEQEIAAMPAPEEEQK